MGLYHPVSTKGSCAIAVCDRCHMKMSLDALKPDGNSPGLRVCNDCWDIKDPWRLPARKTENITLRYPRPDVALSVDVDGLYMWINNDTHEVLWTNAVGEVVSWVSADASVLGETAIAGLAIAGYAVAGKTIEGFV